MAEQLVLRKRNRDLNRVCTSYSVTTTTKFTLETCDPVVAYIRDSRGNVIAVLTEQSPTTMVTSNGTYNICLEGEGVGTLWAQPWSNGGEVEDCCDELRAKDIELQNLINSLETRVTNIINGSTETGCCVALERELNDLKDRVDALEQGGGASANCCNELRQRLTVVEGDIAELKNRMSTVEGDITNIINQISQIDDTNTVTTIIAGNNVSVTDTGTNGNHIYTISATGGSGGGTLPIDFNITNGANVQVQRSGNQFTISATDTVPDVNKAYVDAAIAGISGTLPSDFNITNGANVQVVKNGNTYIISATDTDTVPDVDKAYVDAAIAGISGESSAHAAMPSTYVERVSVPRNQNSEFVAPADGYFALVGASNASTASGNGQIVFEKTTPEIAIDTTVPYRAYWLDYRWNIGESTVSPWFPMSKGETMKIRLERAYVFQAFFVYCNGSVPANP